MSFATLQPIGLQAACARIATSKAVSIVAAQTAFNGNPGAEHVSISKIALAELDAACADLKRLQAAHKVVV